MVGAVELQLLTGEEMREPPIDADIEGARIVVARDHLDVGLHRRDPLGQHPRLLLRRQQARQNLLGRLIGGDRYREQRLHNRRHQRGVGQLVELAGDLQRGRHR